MNWKNTLPKEPGFYWWKRPNYRPHIVLLQENYLTGELFVLTPGSETKISIFYIVKNSEWLGPMPAPPADGDLEKSVVLN